MDRFEGIAACCNFEDGCPRNRDIPVEPLAVNSFTIVSPGMGFALPINTREE